MITFAPTFDDSRFKSIATQAGKFAVVLGLHVALVAWALHAKVNTLPESVPIWMDMRTIEPQAKNTQDMSKHVVAQSKPISHPVQTVARRLDSPAPSDVQVNTPALEEAAAKVAVAEPLAKVGLPTSAQPLITTVRFDADYLQNPVPVYPRISRKLREEGNVLLRVQVTAKGEVENVEIKQSSGYLRLDEAALNAVRTWRFVPARRGTEPIGSSVVVPMLFRPNS